MQQLPGFYTSCGSDFSLGLLKLGQQPLGKTRTKTGKHTGCSRTAAHRVEQHQHTRGTHGSQPVMSPGKAAMKSQKVWKKSQQILMKNERVLMKRHRKEQANE